MKLRQRPSPLLLLLLPCLHFTYAIRSSEQVAALAQGKIVGPSPSLPANLAVQTNLDASLIAKDVRTDGKDGEIPVSVKKSDTVIGTKGAPLDGKDGRPHQGPFVETNAERDRKKAKESGDEEIGSSSKKPGSKEEVKGASSVDGPKMPETNDGVMDDPNRLGPKEGTRGTEGGISEKNRMGKTQEGTTGLVKSEKKPDPPKEVPPLPHSEQEKLGKTDAKDPGKKSKETGIEDEEKPKEKQLGGLEVMLLSQCPLSSNAERSNYRNLPTSRRSLTIYPIPFHPPLP